MENIPGGIDRRQILFIDAIAVSFRVTNLSYGGLWTELQQEVQADDSDRLSRVSIQAWSFIDAVHRLNALVGQMPGLKHSASTKYFLRETAAVTNLRNVYQHLSTEIAGIVDSGAPVWGTITWLEVVSPTQFMSHGYMLGNISTEVIQKAINPADIKTMQPPIDHIHLEASGQWLNLSDIFRCCETFARRLESATALAYAEVAEDTSEAKLRIRPGMD